MNIDDGRVIPAEDIVKQPEPSKWTQFEIGEIVMLKGISFKVHDVSDQRLVLKFTKA